MGRALAGLFSLVLLGLSLIATLYGVAYGFGLKCDESCGQGRGWKYDADAWQWQLLGWSGLALLTLAIVVFVATLARRGWIALAAFLGWYAFAMTSLVLLA